MKSRFIFDPSSFYLVSYLPPTELQPTHPTDHPLQQKNLMKHRSGFCQACLPHERLFQGETDGSSFPNGGLRVTHSAAAFTTWDRASPPFVMDKCPWLKWLPTWIHSYTWWFHIRKPRGWGYSLMVLHIFCRSEVPLYSLCFRHSLRQMYWWEDALAALHGCSDSQWFKAVEGHWYCYRCQGPWACWTQTIMESSEVLRKNTWRLPFVEDDG